MGETEARCLGQFPEWLRTLGADARTLAGLLNQSGLPEPARRHVAAGLNYLFKSLDLIPDGLDDIGFIDDAFVLRAVAAQAASAGLGSAGGEAGAALQRLAADVRLIHEFLGADSARFDRFVGDLERVKARGRGVDEIVGSTDVAAELAREVAAWADSYVPPAFLRDEKNLVKLRAFLTTKLPS
jgi:uncharacterized membrane protein YkvA (DUF1232 family)